jgi:hypothetical protein
MHQRPMKLPLLGIGRQLLAGCRSSISLIPPSVAVKGLVTHAEKRQKVFFFEKKNQKTFAN